MSIKEKIIQKFWGGVIAAAAVVLPFVLHDVTASVFFLPLGITVIATKEKVI